MFKVMKLNLVKQLMDESTFAAVLVSFSVVVVMFT